VRQVCKRPYAVLLGHGGSMKTGTPWGGSPLKALAPSTL
jgi:hypothetical protein